MPTVIDFPANVTHKRHIHDMLDTAGTVDLPDIDWVACTVTFPDGYPQAQIDDAVERFTAYDPAQSELDMLANYLADSPVEGMTPLEAFQFVTDAINGATTVAQVKNVLQQTLPVLVAFMIFEMHHVRDDDRL